LAIHVALNHVTHYKYDRLVSLGPQIVRLRPAPHCRTPILSYSLKVEPADHFINWQQDPFSNYLARLVFPEMTREFKVTIDLVAEMAVYNPFDFFLEESAEKFPFAYDEALATELAPYRVVEPATPRLAEFVASIPRTPVATMDFMVALNQRIQGDIGYLIRMEPGVQTPEETLALASGSCRDSGWLMVAVLRHLGLAARFVSGYLIQLAPDQKALDGPSGTEVDFTDLHAWCEVYLPGAGWIGFDPTSGLLAGEGHIPLACTPQPSSAAPISGGVDESEVAFSHHMGVTRIWESPRVTLPYSEEQWQAVLALGDRVDAQLVAGDVRLTMGGEPTFVSIDDRDGAEWNTDALGPTKRMRAQELVLRLRDHYGAGGFLHYGQGKWYPGEQLPRGRCRSAGAPTASRAGPIRACSPTSACRRPIPPPMRSASARRWRASWAWSTPRCRPASKTLSTISGASASCRSTSIRSTPACPTNSSAIACVASTRKGSRRPSATCCRCAANRAPAWSAGAGSPARGTSAASACT
jgi:transglutaminase-like putative cysteine protease